MSGQALMAKKRAKKDRPLRDSVTTFRSTEEWREWFDRLTDHSMIAPADVIHLALVDYARKVGFPDPPPKR